MGALGAQGQRAGEASRWGHDWGTAGSMLQARAEGQEHGAEPDRPGLEVRTCCPSLCDAC